MIAAIFGASLGLRQPEDCRTPEIRILIGRLSHQLDSSIYHGGYSQHECFFYEVIEYVAWFFCNFFIFLCRNIGVEKYLPVRVGMQKHSLRSR